MNLIQLGATALASFIISTLPVAAAMAPPASASKHDGHHGKHDDHDHDHDHAADEADKAAKPATGEIAFPADIRAAKAAGGEVVTVDILGVVCDFCSTALGKTFAKRPEVAASYVDLDTKTLTIVFVPNKTIDDATIRSLIKKAGYNATTIARNAGQR